MLEHLTSLVHLNVQFINTKLDILSAEFWEFYIITLNETWLINNIFSQDISLHGFQKPLRRDREGKRYRGGHLFKNSYIYLVDVGGSRSWKNKMHLSWVLYVQKEISDRNFLSTTQIGDKWVGIYSVLDWKGKWYEYLQYHHYRRF